MVSLLLTDGGEGAEEEGTGWGGEGRGGSVELKEELVEFSEELRTSVLATKLADASYRAFLRLVLADCRIFATWNRIANHIRAVTFTNQNPWNGLYTRCKDSAIACIVTHSKGSDWWTWSTLMFYLLQRFRNLLYSTKLIRGGEQRWVAWVVRYLWHVKYFAHTIQWELSFQCMVSIQVPSSGNTDKQSTNAYAIVWSHSHTTPHHLMIVHDHQMVWSVWQQGRELWTPVLW